MKPLSNGQRVTKNIQADKQHTKPCHDCPFSVRAVKGWLGRIPASADLETEAKEFVAFIRTDGPFYCHVFSGKKCTGAYMFRANLRNATSAAKTEVFSSCEDFVDYHSGEEGRGN